METNYTPRFTGQDVTQQITSYIDELANATDAARLSSEMLKYLETVSLFHDYSFQNILLITLSCPHATQVAGFRKWQSLNRFVRKGEKGIPILAPIFEKKELETEDKKSVLKGFKVVYVFDISQTNGEPLPEPPDWKSPERNEELQQRLIAFVQERNIQVSVQHLAGEVQGISKGGKIVLADSAGTSTLIHELAHELMHREGEGVPALRSLKELEAEAVAFVVSRHFGLESKGSPNYIALHGNDSKLIQKHLERIRSVASEIIEHVEIRRPANKS